MRHLALLSVGILAPVAVGGLLVPTVFTSMFGPLLVSGLLVGGAAGILVHFDPRRTDRGYRLPVLIGSADLAGFLVANWLDGPLRVLYFEVLQPRAFVLSAREWLAIHLAVGAVVSTSVAVAYVVRARALQPMKGNA